MPDQPRARWRREHLLPLLLLLVASALYLIHASAYRAWIDDDAGISYTYARNLAQGHGLVLNPGGERVEGYSNPLWVFLLAVTFRLGLFDPVVTPKLLSIVAALASFLLLARISRRIFGHGESTLHLLPALALACSVPFTAWSISGLENAFYIILILLAIDLRLSELEGTAKLPVSGLVLFLVAITRPEGILYFAAAGGHAAVRALVNRRLTRRDWIWAAGFAVPFLTYHLWHYLYFADLLPNTYYAKMQMGGATQHLHEELLDFKSSGWKYLAEGLLAQNLRWLLPLAILVTSVSFIRRRSAGGWLILLFVLVAAFYPVFVGGDWMLQHRFLTPLFAFSYLIVAGALVSLVSALTALRNHAILRMAAAVILVAMTTGLTLLPARALFEKPIKPPSVSFARISERGRRFGALAKELGVTHASLMDPDLGGTSYASGLRLIDLVGLADVHIARHDYDPRYFGRYVFVEQRPTFIHTHCGWSLRSGLHQHLDLRRDYITLSEEPCLASCCPGTLNGEYVRKDVIVDASPDIEQPLEATFENGPTLVGLRLAPRIVQPGHAVHLTTWWTTTAPLVDGARLRVTPLGPGAARLVPQDRAFAHGIYPLSRWRPDEMVREEHEITIPAEEAVGPHQIEIQITGVGAAVSQVVTTFEVAPSGAGTGPPVEETDASMVDSSLREADSLIETGDLRAATDMLIETREGGQDDERLDASLSRLSDLWYRRGEEILETGESFLRWGEAMNAFQSALTCRPANAFARKRIEQLRSRDHVDRFYGRSIREAHEGAAEDVAGLLVEIEDAGFSEEVDEILRGSGTIRRHLEDEGTLGSLCLLHRAIAQTGDAGRLAAVQEGIDTIAPLHVAIGDRLVYLGSDLQPRGPGSTRITWWFQVMGKIDKGYKIFLHALPDEPPGKTKSDIEPLNFDHFPETDTNYWQPGTIVRHSFTARLPAGAWRLEFGFFESGGKGRLTVKGTESPAVEMGRFQIR